MKILYNKGYSLIELLIILSIIIVISAISMPKLIEYRREQAIKNTTENIISILNKAKSDSLNSLNSTNYGIHFESNYLVYFIGPVYLSGDINNKIINFEPGVTTTPNGGINLNGGGNDIIFPRLIDDVIGYGNITIEVTEKLTLQKIITINKIGSISVN